MSSTLLESGIKGDEGKKGTQHRPFSELWLAVMVDEKKGTDLLQLHCGKDILDSCSQVGLRVHIRVRQGRRAAESQSKTGIEWNWLVRHFWRSEGEGRKDQPALLITITWLLTIEFWLSGFGSFNAINQSNPTSAKEIPIFFDGMVKGWSRVGRSDSSQLDVCSHTVRCYLKIDSGLNWQRRRKETPPPLEERTNAFCPRGRVGEEVYHTLSFFEHSFLRSVFSAELIDYEGQPQERSCSAQPLVPSIPLVPVRFSYRLRPFRKQTRRQWSNHFKVLVLEEWQKIAKTREQKGHWHRG